MAALARTLVNQSALIRKNGLLGIQLVRNAGHWNKDWKPGPYPVTKEERDAAARKYGLHPDEYEPYPDDGLGLGDYPKLPLISADARDPHRNWDYPEHRRDFGEPLHADFDMIGLDRMDLTSPKRFSSLQMIGSFLGVMALFTFTLLFFEDKKMHFPLLPKQFPADGAKHYTFEPIDD